MLSTLYTKKLSNHLLFAFFLNGVISLKTSLVFSPDVKHYLNSHIYFLMPPCVHLTKLLHCVENNRNPAMYMVWACSELALII